MSGINNVTQVTKFCGCSVTGIQSSAGFQEQASSIKIDLVEDIFANDLFQPPTVGTPLSFVFEGYRFDGIVQRYGQTNSVSGTLYNVTLYSPIEILEAVQIILDAYSGVQKICPNLLNVYGYLEDDGNNFGGSGKNESGISWNLVQEAIEAIQLKGTDFSTGISYKGHTYKVDFGALPAPPDFYRLGGGAFVSLNQAIRTVFEDSGYDYITCLKVVGKTGPHVISFKSRSKLHPENTLGQIAAFAESQDNIVSFEDGLESRNDITCGVIFGGEDESIYQLNEPGDGSVIWNFWGYQQNPSLVPFTLQGNEPIVESTGFGNQHTAVLNAIPIIDILGSPNGPPTYTATVLEMRLALVDFDSWATYVALYRPDIPAYFGLDVFPSIFGKFDFVDNSPQSMYADDKKAVSVFTNPYADQAPMEKIERVYNFVRNQAETYLGKQMIVRLPLWLKYYFEEETNVLMYNMSINSDGYYPDYVGGFNSGPLGLAYQNFNQFSNDSGKFQPFIKYGGADLAFADLGSRSASDLVTQDNSVFMRCNVDSNIIFTPAPAALCIIDEPLWAVPPDPLGGLQDIANMLNVSYDYLLNIVSMNNGEFPVKLHPWPLSPVGAAICLRNHQVTYGPWYNIGVAGKVKIEQNTGLVPWNYGGFDTMNLAAQAQLADIGTETQQEASGEVTFTGAPTISLGDQLNASGPFVTSIDVSIGEAGVTTTYRMRSQTPVYGAFSKQNADRLRRLGTAAQDIRRQMRALADRQREQQRLSTQSAWTFLKNTSRALTFKNSNTVFHAFTSVDPNTGNVLAQAAMHGFGAATGASNAHDDDKFQATASMGVEGLLRPFSTYVNNPMLPRYETPVSGVVSLITSISPTSTSTPTFSVGRFSSSPTPTPTPNLSLDPFQVGADIMWAAVGQTFNGFNKVINPNGSVGTKVKPITTSSSPNPTSTSTPTPTPDPTKRDVRVMGLRGPLAVVGWGREITGKPCPNEMDIPPSGGTPFDLKIQDMTNKYLPSYLTQFNKWKAGPVDLRWNKWRKVWGFPTILFGTYKSNPMDATKATVVIEDLLDEVAIDSSQYLGGTFDDGLRVCIGYNDLKDKWYIISAACS